MTLDWLLVPAAFLLGTFPSALLIGALVGHDPIEEGSGNPGATNMFRIAGKKAGLATLIFDVAKALLATLVGTWLVDETFGVVCGAAAVLGHMFPILRASRGGKGVACYGGLAIAAWPLVALVAFVVWVGAARISGHSFIGALFGVPTVVVGTVVIGRPIAETLVVALVAAVVIARHHRNISDFLTARRSASAD